MSQSTPTAVTKRKVMGRMDAGSSDSPSSSVTPNARPRIVRAQHGYSSPSLSNQVTPTAARPTPGTGRARVDMSAFASPSSTASSPAMSPSLSARPMSASSSTSTTITARLSAQSPTVRSTPTFHARSGSTVGVSTSSYKLGEARIDAAIDPNLASLRSPKIRARNGSVDFGTPSPSVASPSVRASASSQLAPSAPLRSPLPRADQSPFQKPSTPSTSTRPTASIPPRAHLSPQRSQVTLDRAAATTKTRAPSPNPSAASQSFTATTSAHQTSPAKPRPVTHNSEPILSARQASIPVPLPTAAKVAEPTRDLNSSNASAALSDNSAVYAISPSESRGLSNVGAATRLEPGSAMTTGRAGLRPAPALQRAALPPSFMDLASAIAPLSPSAEHRTSFGSSALSALSAAQPLSPSSETPRSPSEVGEAEEARVHRKLLDLEITNKSLLAINSALEVTKLKQAKEIRELKRRLRDGRGLPTAAAPRDSAASTVFSDEDDLSDTDDDDNLLVKEDPELEAAHQRCKDLVDHMVDQARKAILAEYDEPENTGGKVLHPAELEEMQRELDEEGNDTEADTTVATDLLDTSMTFDRSTGDISKDEQLPSSSSLKFSQENLVDGSSASSSSLGATSLVQGVSLEAKAPSLMTLHPDSAYGRNPPLHGDVSID
ncbi:uncharacterized protein SRS1_11078 [Sporisorium reilianum f. sp. reilianum]|uniref:Uncharacterized protein n=1 Tax=Sporisorium reilianum f. sp. reilianum TaxID=72559 RepID=A0A2N8UF92_9BASI|nr:uncharacterized protein SRS1_11078 [Sporisorium reilianum f. sp. reilianum]